MTSIGDYAFENCRSLLSIDIPKNVTNIGYIAFAGDSSLTYFNVDTDNTNYSSSNGILFNKGKTILIQYPAGKTGSNYTIPNSVTTIGERAF